MEKCLTCHYNVEHDLRKVPCFRGEPACFQGGPSMWKPYTNADKVRTKTDKELEHAALKVARVLRGENPTPVTMPEAKKMVIEELSDLIVAYQELGLNPDPEIMQRKKQRWDQRRGRQA